MPESSVTISGIRGYLTPLALPATADEFLEPELLPPMVKATRCVVTNSGR